MQVLGVCTFSVVPLDPGRDVGRGSVRDLRVPAAGAMGAAAPGAGSGLQPFKLPSCGDARALAAASH